MKDKNTGFHLPLRTRFTATLVGTHGFVRRTAKGSALSKPAC